jgi:acetyl esterase
MHGLMPIYQLLVYPITNYNFNTPRTSRKHTRYRWTGRACSGSGVCTCVHPPMGPIRTPHRCARGACRACPGHGHYRSERSAAGEGEAYALRLRRFGVPVVLTRYNGMMHEFFGMGAVIAKAKQAEAEAARGLDSARSH